MMRALLFGIDPRTLGLVRICVALLVLSDLGARAVDLTAHYSDAGVLTRAEQMPQTLLHRMSPFLISGEPKVIAGLFALSAIAAMFLLVGRYTRVAGPLTWFLLVSLQARNPYILDGGDRILALLLWWGLFTPWGGRLSLDARRGERLPDQPVLSIGTAALCLQMPVAYLVTGILKDGEDWHPNFTAVYYVLHNAAQVDAPSTWTAGWPLPLLRALGAATWALELVGPLLLFVPSRRWTVRLRLLLMGAFGLLQFGIFLFMYRSLFAPVSIVGLLPLLPARLWRGVGRAGPETGTDPAARPIRPGQVLAWLCAAIAGLDALSQAVYRDSGVSDRRAPDPIRYLREALRLSQRWDMFAPNPSHRRVYYVVVAALPDGQQVDGIEIARRRPVDFGLPNWRETRFGTRRWRAFSYLLQRGKSATRLARYLCNIQPGAADEIAVYVMEAQTRIGQPHQFHKRLLTRRSCLASTRVSP